ncbi:GNAT family N-acetyltransferase [Ascidiimonas aurantiaca]|uniref:GNAT family N-acetyltransferase n=1 Tax=Ascidiimonas aurantiaca TaxID=1685432 RepID=UPI0030EDFF61
MANNSVPETCTEKDIQIILKGINDFNLSKVPALSEWWTPLNFTVKNKNREVIAGILAGIGYWKGLEIKILWVNEKERHKGIGSRLLQYTEEKARELGAVISMLDTFNFQAENFYLRHGYSIFGEIKDFPRKGDRRIYLSKRF